MKWEEFDEDAYMANLADEYMSDDCEDEVDEDEEDVDLIIRQNEFAEKINSVCKEYANLGKIEKNCLWFSVKNLYIEVDEKDRK